MFRTKAVEKIKTNHFMFNNLFFRKSCRLWDNGEKYCRGHRWQYGACALRATWLRLHTHNMHYSLLFHSNNDYTNAPHCYVIRTLPVLFVTFTKDRFEARNWSIKVLQWQRGQITKAPFFVSTTKHQDR